MSDLPIANPQGQASSVLDDHRRLLAGTHSEESVGNVLFRVWSTSIEDGKGDLFVALGLARALDARGWGVSFQPVEDWGGHASDLTTVCVSMIEAFPHTELRDDVVRVAWARNRIRDWAESPLLHEYDCVLASSVAATNHFQEGFAGFTATLPIAVDPDLFKDLQLDRTLPVTTTINYWGHDRGLVAEFEDLDIPQKVHWFGHGLDQVTGLSPSVLRQPAVHYVDLAQIYAQSRIVLDDMTPPTREFGNQNSRLFEALAAGALTIVNCQTGLEELGLEAVPYATNASTLGSVIEQQLENESARAMLAERLRQVVLGRHTFQHRAQAFEQFIAASREPMYRRVLRSLTEEYEALATDREHLREALEQKEILLQMQGTELHKYRTSRVVRLAHAIGSMLGRR